MGFKQICNSAKYYDKIIFYTSERNRETSCQTYDREKKFKLDSFHYIFLTNSQKMSCFI